jgi:hypothetical protein
MYIPKEWNANGQGVGSAQAKFSFQNYSLTKIIFTVKIQKNTLERL